MLGEYDGQELTEKWISHWMDDESYRGIYEFDSSEWSTKFIIDTPPPFTTGIPHMGHAMWWALNDTIARFKRMRGHNVLLPQGWDCQGLPTEVKVEEEFDVSPEDTEEFVRTCQDYTEDMIDAMKSRMTNLGYMPDWDYEYRTMDDSYHKLVQKSLGRLVEQDLVCQKEFPNHWCPECETAIAKAEIERERRDAPIYTIDFPVDGDDSVEIATTRPELLPACVAIAIHPDDEDHPGLADETVSVPLVDRDVPVITDEDVDSEFGSGVVMICTFGDEEDRNWVYENDLDIIESVDKQGHLTGEMGPYAGLDVETARTTIVDDLDEEGYLRAEETTTQDRGIHDRCDTPVEIILTEQWFINVLDHTEEMVEYADDIEWLPGHMQKRYEQWTNGLNWDWCISRQRRFGTPLPFWSCEDCSHFACPDEENLPVDPRIESDLFETCPQCGGDMEATSDVADCWVDSSVSVLRLVGWEEYEHWDKLYPVEMREQGHDIVRTWAFYSIFRCSQLTGEPPWKSIYLNGMVLDDEGKKMSKSRGNVVIPDDILDDYDPDAIRQGIVQISPGEDIPFSLKDVEFGQRFATKIWNISKFAAGTLEEYDPEITREDVDLEVIDEWILSELARYLDQLTTNFEGYRIDRALDLIYEFIWHTLADDYLEIVKQRLYGDNEAERLAAQYTLYTVLKKSIRSIAPLMPFITEEIHHELFDQEDAPSVHGTSWPTVDVTDIDDDALENGHDAVEIIRSLRRYKSENDVALNAELGTVTLYAPDGFDATQAVQDAMQIESMVVHQELPTISEEVVQIDLDLSSIGPEYGELAKEIQRRVNERENIEIDDGTVSFDIGGQALKLIETEDYDVVREYSIEGKEGDFVQTDDFVLLIE